METVIVGFLEIENAIKKITTNLAEMRTTKTNFETKVTELGTYWVDTVANSYDGYKNSTLKITKDIETNIVEIETLMKKIEEALTMYKENETKGEQSINSVEF